MANRILSLLDGALSGGAAAVPLPKNDYWLGPTNGQTAFTLSLTPISNDSITFSVNGQKQTEGAGKNYTVIGSTITWLDKEGFTMETTFEVIAHYWYLP